MALPVLADASWLGKICAESRNQQRSLEPNSAALREKENTRRKKGGRSENDRNHLCVNPSGSWDVFTFEGIVVFLKRTRFLYTFFFFCLATRPTKVTYSARMSVAQLIKILSETLLTIIYNTEPFCLPECDFQCIMK